MNKNFLLSKHISLIAIGITACLILLFSLIGIAAYGYEIYCWNGCSYWYYSLYDALGYIFIPIIGGLALIILFFTILFYFSKLHFVRIHKFMSGADYLGIFGVTLAQIILVSVYINRFTVAGVFTLIIGISLLAFSFAAAVLSFYQLAHIKPAPKPKSEKQKAQDSATAAQKLKTLKQLYDQGIITEEEYNEKKKKYIEML